jgi:hypothetical protein
VFFFFPFFFGCGGGGGGSIVTVGVKLRTLGTAATRRLTEE